MKKLIFISLALCITIQAQTKRDPRVVGMAGAYTTIAQGIFSVGYNPGLIGLQQNKPFMYQGFQFDFGLVGNFFSIENIAAYSGDTLDTKEKNAIFRELEAADGMSFFMDTHMPIPLLNLSIGNKAFSANNMILQNYRLPIGLLELIMYGNGQKTNLDLEFNYEILGMNEYGFSFGIPFKSMSWGVTAKYMQGLFYLGVDEDSSYSNLITDDEGIYGESDGVQIWISSVKMSNEALIGTILHESLHNICTINDKDICEKDEHAIMVSLGEVLDF